MLSLKATSESIPIAMTIDKKHTIYKSKRNANLGQKEIEFPEEPLEEHKSLIPYFDFKYMKSGKKSIRMFISGSTGSGKTYLCEQILKTSFKKAPVIYLFSSIWDEDYKTVKNLIHLDIDEFYEENPNIDIYEKLHPNSVCIFDDILSFDDKKLKKYIKLRDQCLSVGRHKDISTICIEQQPRNYTKSRIVLLNSEMYIFFPKSSYMPFKKTCEEYIGLTKNKIEELGQHRYIAIYKNYPSYYITDFKVSLL